jgi:hypothetical protein
MRTRTLIVMAAAAVAAGCVDSERLRSSLGGPPAAETAPDPKAQTLASRVLGAMALEAVTKRAPDPERLNQLRR